MTAMSSTWGAFAVCIVASQCGVAQTSTPPIETRPWMQEDQLQQVIRYDIGFYSAGNRRWTEANSKRVAEDVRWAMANRWTWERENTWAKRNADRMAIGTNEVLLARIREEFKALPRPLVKSLYNRKLHSGMGHMGCGFGLTKWELGLTPEANAFRSRYIATNTTGALPEALPLVVALYPMLDDPYYSGDAILMMCPVVDGAHIAGNWKYVSPTQPGEYAQKGMGARRSLRSALRADYWLDADGKPIVIPRTALRQVGVPAEECEDRTNRPPAKLQSSTNPPPSRE